jgi:hypothetical protein
MFAKLARHLTNGGNTAPQPRPATLPRATVNGRVRAAQRPDQGRRTLVCRWRVLPGRTALACVWEVEVPDGFGQPVRPTKRPAVFLVSDDASGRLRADDIAVGP